MKKDIKLPENTKIKVKQKNIQLSLTDNKVKRELNTLLLPFFKFWKWPRTWKFKYIINYWSRSWTIEIIGDSELWAPTEFDYNVFLSLMKIYEDQKSDVIKFSLKDIFAVLNLKNSWTNYQLIKDSIKRLVRTTYEVKNVFLSQKIHNWEKEVTIEQEKNFHLFEVSDERKLEIDNTVVTSDFSLRMSSLLRDNIKNKYFKYYDSEKLLWLKRGGLKRFYEIVDFWRNGKIKHNFYYDTLSLMIPLSSWRMNKVYIKQYAQTLVDKEYIDSFEMLDKSIQITFLKWENEKVNDNNEINSEDFEKAKEVLKWLQENFWLSDGIIRQIIKEESLERIKRLKEYAYQCRKEKLWTNSEIQNFAGFFVRLVGEYKWQDIPKTKEELRKQREQVNMT